MSKKIFVFFIISIIAMFMLSCDVTPPATYTLTVDIVDLDGNPASDRGDYTITPEEGPYEEGKGIVLNSEANSGYGFVEWRDAEDEVVSSEEEYRFVMPAEDLTLKLVFGAEVQIITKVIDETGVEHAAWGEVLPGTGQYAEGTDVIFSGKANPGYAFVEWWDETETLISPEVNYTHTVGDIDETLNAVMEEYPFSFGLVNYDENVFQLPMLEGNYIMITFSAGWCPHCHTQADYMGDVYSQLETSHGVTNFYNVVILIQGNGSSPATLDDIQDFHDDYSDIEHILMDDFYKVYNAYDDIVNDPDFGGLPSNVILRPISGGFEYVDFWAGAYPTASGLISGLQTMVPDMFGG
jgi:thiol-disulfide isomerase/thioredoxin